MSKYFGKTLAEEKGLSGDDQNRRHRERNLGFKEPSPDWADCKQEIRCIWPGQKLSSPVVRTLTGQVYFHNAPDNLLGHVVVV